MAGSPLEREPIRDPQSIDQLLGMQEDERTEFKRATWRDGAEAAKDVASFANADGGEIVVGVVEDGAARASSFENWAQMDDAAAVQQLRALLITHIRPRDFTDKVLMVPIRTSAGTRACVVDVPPSASVVAVGYGSDRDQKLGFPIRSGRETRWMSFDEVESRMLSEERVALHRLRRFSQTPGERPAALLAGIWFPAYRQPAKLETVRLKFRMLSETHLVLEWTCDVHFYGSGLQASVTQRELSIPLALIRRVFPREGGGVHVELRADLLWDGIAFGFGRVTPG